MKIALPLRPVHRTPVPGDAVHAGCAERFRLRQEHIERLAEFNRAAARHRMVQRVGMRGPAADASWRAVRESCAASNRAWAQYRRHVALHGCKDETARISRAAA